MSTIFWNSATRRWLPPALLLALIAAVWALPYRPNCAALAWDNDPAIARAGNECILLSAYGEKLRIVQAGIEYAEREILPDDTFPDSWRESHQRVMSYGPETVALADAIWDSALYQSAVAEGHSPSGQEVAARTDQDLRRSEASSDLFELARLANESDLTGFSRLLRSSDHPDLVTMRENIDESDSEFMALIESWEWEEQEFRQFEEMLLKWEAYIQSVGRGRYWKEILPAKLRREMAITKLEGSILDASADGPDGPYAEVPRLAWLAYQQKALEEKNIGLTHAAPVTVSVDRALAYLAERRTQEQEQLNEEYRKLLDRQEYRKLIERREERRRLTPAPPRPNTN